MLRFKCWLTWFVSASFQRVAFGFQIASLRAACAAGFVAGVLCFKCRLTWFVSASFHHVASGFQVASLEAACAAGFIAGVLCFKCRLTWFVTASFQLVAFVFQAAVMSSNSLHCWFGSKSASLEVQAHMVCLSFISACCVCVPSSCQVFKQLALLVS